MPADSTRSETVVCADGSGLFSTSDALLAFSAVAGRDAVSAPKALAATMSVSATKTHRKKCVFTSRAFFGRPQLRRVFVGHTDRGEWGLRSSQVILIGNFAL